VTDLIVTFNSVSLPANATVTLVVKEDADGDGVFENEATTTLTDGQTEYSLSGFDGTDGNDVRTQLRPANSDDVSSATISELVDVAADETFQRTVTITGNGATATTHGPLTRPRSPTVVGDGNTDSHRLTARQRSTTINGDGETGGSRSTSKPRSPIVSGSGETTASRGMDKRREPALHAETANTATQVLRPVFPDERALDVSWDFTAEHMGFASEWLDETTHINASNRDGVGVTIGGSLSTTIDIFIQYDQTGDGIPDVTSNVKRLTQAYSTLGFDDTELFGDDGWYRVIVRGLRAGDTVNQLDIGAIHKNL